MTKRTARLMFLVYLIVAVVFLSGMAIVRVTKKEYFGATVNVLVSGYIIIRLIKR